MASHPPFITDCGGIPAYRFIDLRKGKGREMSTPLILL